MKRTLLCSVLSLFSFLLYAQDANVSVSNLTSNCYYAGYDTATHKVTGLNFEVLADGDNSSNIIPDFVVKAYLWATPAEDGQQPIYVATYNVSGFHQIGSRDFSNLTIDLSQVSDIPDGTYRLGIYVDANDDIPNPPDDPSDNTYLLQAGNGNNNIVYKAGGWGSDEGW